MVSRIVPNLEDVESKGRPSEALVKDFLSNETRAERKTLLGVSAIAIIIARTGLIPTKISGSTCIFISLFRLRSRLWSNLKHTMYAFRNLINQSVGFVVK